MAELHFERVDEPPLELRQNWVSGDDPATGAHFELDCGAGLGSPRIVLRVDLPEGETVWEVADIRPALNERVRAILGGTTP